MLGVFAMLAAGLVTACMAQKDVAADRQRMVEEIDAMVASTASTSGVARLDPRVRAAMAATRVRATRVQVRRLRKPAAPDRP